MSDEAVVVIGSDDEGGTLKLFKDGEGLSVCW